MLVSDYARFLIKHNFLEIQLILYFYLKIANEDSYLLKNAILVILLGTYYSIKSFLFKMNNII